MVLREAIASMPRAWIARSQIGKMNSNSNVSKCLTRGVAKSTNDAALPWKQGCPCIHQWHGSCQAHLVRCWGVAHASHSARTANCSTFQMSMVAAATTGCRTDEKPPEGLHLTEDTIPDRPQALVSPEVEQKVVNPKTALLYRYLPNPNVGAASERYERYR